MKSFAKVFSVIFLPIFIILGIGFYFMNNITVTHSEKEVIQELKNKWVILSSTIKSNNDNILKLDGEFRKISDETLLRITLITTEGNVIMDTFVHESMVSLMENHRNRPEIKSALYNREGVSSRYSSTLDVDMMYYAKKLSDNMVLRISYPMTHIIQLKKALSNQIWWLFASLSFIILLLAIYFARRVSLPIQKLNNIADSIENDERLIHFPHFKDKTMSKVAGLIYRIYNSMIKKQDELSKEQQKLNHIFSIMDQGIILLDENNKVQHYNSWIQLHFDLVLETGNHVYEKTSDIDLISFFSEIIEFNENTVVRKQLKGRTYDIFINNISPEKLIVIIDITIRTEYESFKTELTGNISHELKTPIAMMMMYAETLLNNKEIDDNTSTKFLENIYAAAGRLNNLINDVIELHKLEAAGDTASINLSADLDVLSEDIKSMYELSEKGIQIENDTGNVNIAYEHILSVTTNLIDNAIKYSDGENVYIQIKRVNEQLHINVSDCGPVIPSGERKRIFERFYTRSKSRNKQHSGTGLGLSIVKHIVNIYKGSVKVSSNNKGGNTFQVILAEKSY